MDVSIGEIQAEVEPEEGDRAAARASQQPEEPGFAERAHRAELVRRRDERLRERRHAC